MCMDLRAIRVMALRSILKLYRRLDRVRFIVDHLLQNISSSIILLIKDISDMEGYGE